MANGHIPRERHNESSMSLSKTGNLIFIPKKPRQKKDKVRIEANIQPKLPPRYINETPPIIDVNTDALQNFIYDGDIEMM